MNDLADVVRKCGERFREYESAHAEKAEVRHPGKAGEVERQSRLDKAARNREMAELCEQALPDLEQLLEEVAYWRRETYARAWFAAVHVKAAREKGDMKLLAEIKVGQLDPALNAIRDADAKQWHTFCEGCGKPLLNGQLYHPYEDASVHVNCDDPDAAIADKRSMPWDDGFSPKHMAQMLEFTREQADA